MQSAPPLARGKDLLVSPAPSLARSAVPTPACTRVGQRCAALAARSGRDGGQPAAQGRLGQAEESRGLRDRALPGDEFCQLLAIVNAVV